MEKIKVTEGKLLFLAYELKKDERIDAESKGILKSLFRKYPYFRIDCSEKRLLNITDR